MIQILGLREFTSKKTGENGLYDSHYHNNWRAPSVPELFADIDKYLEQIPKAERYNMFYTVANCKDGKREFLSQEIIPIDIDGIEAGTEGEVVDCVCQVLNLPKDKLGIVYSGNGVHILIRLTYAFDNPAFFKSNRVYYKAMCGRINHALFNEGISGQADPSVFSPARLLRLPNTINKKKNKKTQCVLVNGSIEPLNVDLVSLADLPRVGEGDHVSPNAFKLFPKLDAAEIQDGCEFLKHCKKNQEEITEPEWYAMISLVGRLPNGDQLVHEYSKFYSGYSSEATDMKLEHALESAGPRTCDNISTMFDGCKNCTYWGKITSPIQIVGKDFIRTQETGFYNMVIKNGVATKGNPNYDDLAKFFESKHKFFTEAETEVVYIYNGKYWEPINRLELYSFAEDHFDPAPSKHMCNEFEAKIKRMNIKPTNFTQTEGILNFENGVLDLHTMEISEHSPEYGFTYVVPYEYNKEADCPQFDQFMKDITLGDESLEQVILEYMGYCISGTDPQLVQLCAILYGNGANGKSVLLDVLRNIVGYDNCSAVGMKSLTKETGRYPMMYKMVNISDETPSDSFLQSSDFKSVVSGDTIEVRRLYQNPIMWKCTTKMMFACNELPFTSDFSHGLYRRLLILPFNATFSTERGNLDPFLLQKLLKEKTGILNKLIKAYLRFKERGYTFIIPDSVRQQKDEYSYMGDSVMQFCNECINYGETLDGKPFTARSIYKLYCLWCEDVRIKPITFNSFSRVIPKRIKRVAPKVKTERISNGMQKERYYKNIIIDLDNPQAF